MIRLSALLVALLLVLTFNAYACLLPLQSSSQMNCPSSAQEQPRQICDAFVEIGTSSEASLKQPDSLFHAEFHLGGHTPSPFIKSSLPSEPPPDPNRSLHCSIPTTVLRI
jgi:hypothetical protein